MYIYIYICSNIYMRVRTSLELIHISIYVCIYAYVYTYVYIYIYIYTYVRINICACARLCWHWQQCFICVTWLIHMCDMTPSCVCNDSFGCVTWLIHMCDMTHSYVRHDQFVCVTWLYTCVATDSYVWYDSFLRQHDSSLCLFCSSLFFVSPHPWHESFLCATWCGFIHTLTIWHNPIRDMKYSSAKPDIFLCMTWHIPLWLNPNPMNHFYAQHDAVLYMS